MLKQRQVVLFSLCCWRVAYLLRRKLTMLQSQAQQATSPVPDGTTTPEGTTDP